MSELSFAGLGRKQASRCSPPTKGILFAGTAVATAVVLALVAARMPTPGSPWAQGPEGGVK